MRILPSALDRDAFAARDRAVFVRAGVLDGWSRIVTTKRSAER